MRFQREVLTYHNAWPLANAQYICYFSTNYNNRAHSLTHNLEFCCVLPSEEPWRCAPKEMCLERAERKLLSRILRVSPGSAPLRRAGHVTYRVTWLAGQHGCALAGAGWWTLCLGRLRPLAPAALAGRPGGGGRRGRGRRGRGVPRGLVRLRRSSAVRRPRQLCGRASIFAGGERSGPGPQRAAARAHQGAL